MTMSEGEVRATVARYDADDATQTNQRILAEHRRRRLMELLEHAGTHLRGLERQRHAARLDLGEILRAVREHNDGLPDGSQQLISQGMLGRETGLSEAERDELEAHVPDDNDIALPEGGHYRAEDLAGYSNSKIMELWSAWAGEDQPALQAELRARFPVFAVLEFVATQMYHHWQDTTPAWYMADHPEPEWLRVVGHVMDGLRRSITDGPATSQYWPGMTPRKTSQDSGQDSGSAADQGTGHAG